MGSLKRKPFQGVKNIIRFNWHFYLIMLAFMIGLVLLTIYSAYPLKNIFGILLLLGFVPIGVSLAVSYYIYDYSSLYSLCWMDALGIQDEDHIANIHAGFDETSELIHEKYPGSRLSVYDFYDPIKHTEISIKRARKTNPEYPGTQKLNTSIRVMPEKELDYILLILSVHEIRNEEERVQFFKALGDSLRTDGKILVVEHQRDLANFFSYTIGFFHFFSPESWQRVFRNAGFSIQSQKKLNPFITAYTLIHGIAS